MIQVTIPEAQARLPELLSAARNGSPVAIEQGDGWTYQVTAVPPQSVRPRPPVTGIPKAGCLKGQLVVPNELDEPLDELREYTE